MRRFSSFGAVDVGAGGGGVALIAIPDRNREADFGDSFPTFCEWKSFEQFVVVFHAGADGDVGDGLFQRARQP